MCSLPDVGPSYIAIFWRVIHNIEWIPVEVKVQHGDECYDELKVLNNNKTHLLTQKNHILKTYKKKTVPELLLVSGR